MQDASTRLTAAFAEGCRHHQAGRLDEAIACYDEALEIAPAFVGAHYNRGNALVVRGRAAAAIDCFRRAVDLVPDFVEAQINLGIALREENRLDEAIACLRRAVALRPDVAQAHDALGNALHAKGLLIEAAAHHRAAIERNPDFAEAHANLGNVLRGQGLFDQAVACHRTYVALRPRDAGGHDNLGHALLDMGDAAAAIACHRAAIARDPRSASSYNNLGNALQQAGDLDAAYDAFATAVALAPRRGLFHRMLANTGRLAPDGAAARAMADLLRDESLADADRMELHFALGAVHGDAGDHEQAFGHLLAGNRRKRRAVPYDEAAALGAIERTARIFSAALLSSRAAEGVPSTLPIFVVGMPRSGTTLVEQILASHPDIFGAGELPDLPRLTGPLENPELFARISGDELRMLGVAYRDAIRARAPDASRIVDKLPDNFRRVGLIHMILPRAKIIHVRRDKLDTCLSCFSKVFSGHVPYSYELGELGRYYRAYETLMDHWRRVLPAGVMLDIHYEELVREPRREIERMLAHCDMAWDPRCLEFHHTKRLVRTASNVQVRRPLHANAVGRWHGLGDRAAPLVAALAG